MFGTSNRIFFRPLLAIVGVLIAVVAARPYFSKYRSNALGSLPEIGSAPTFVLTGENNMLFDSKSLNGKIWVANFFFTSCQGPCPMMSAKMAILQDAVQRERKVQLVSISVDPETDTPKVLSEYAKRFKANSETWHFLTGNRHDIVSLAERGFQLAASGEEASIHSTRFVLVDQSGQIRGYYNSEEEKEIERLKNDIRRLL